ncbi:cell adhesion molecule CEACAM18 isoform X1 [Homo sapiens]|uniref:cell adhesion molecule CEACAM18 isoform X1 n=1 Tax=Homo sapiens TaxID=9606 RepID=UPI0023DF2F75|nr:carcinoembryonic antigen-related cell adhesion molecule 18 isoform X1 [Homo sapiens]
MDLSRPRWSLWRRVFLMASLLACGICQASGQIFITQTLGIKGYRTVVALDKVPEDVQEYSWYWGANDSAGNMIISHKPPSAQQPGPMYTGRERVNREGSLLIRPTALNDTGNYTVRVVAGNETQRATGWLEVLELGSNLGISVNASSLVENMDSVAADCHTNVTNITWYVNDVPTSSSDRMTISPDGKTLVILRVSRYDRTIQCMIESFPEIFQRSERISLTVAYGPDYVLLRSNPDDFNGIVTAEIGSQVEMECICYSFLDLKYHWIHNGSLLNFSDAKMNLSSLAWEQMGRYRCTVENPVTQLIMYMDVRIQAPHECPLPSGILPVVHRDFSISGSMVMFLIMLTVLGGVYICGVLIHALINHYSIRTNRAP